MFAHINLQDQSTLPRTKIYEHTIRFQLHIYLLTAPDYLVQQLHKVSFSYLKYKVKKYMIERYSSLCTKIGCQVCHMSYINR